tara:strand:- start:2839 stop:3345 length:507 start_codon:yes stop_codon:yes gene_type:complete
VNRIKNIRTIEQLAIYDTIIRTHAKILIKDNNLAEDIVQNVYVAIDKYLRKYPEKVIDGGFVSMSIRNRAKNYYKAYTNRFNFGNKIEQAYIPEKEECFEDLIVKEDEEILYEMLEERIADLNVSDQALIHATFQMNLKEISRTNHLSYEKIRKRYKQLKIILRKDDE